MPNYEAWNSAIAAFFTAGAPKGSSIFLSVDQEALEDVAERFLDEQINGDPATDFVQAVRAACLSFLGTLNLTAFKRPIGGAPGGAGFLGLMVFAAYHMQEEEGIDETNYFHRLREVLALPEGRGRPDGLPAGTEEPLWRAWNAWLIAQGFQTTAERGAGPQTYLRYVFSQAILRESDKQHLRQRYFDAHLPLQFDCDQLGFWLSRQPFTRRHLSEGLHHPDAERVWEFYRAAHRVYEAGDWLERAGTRTVGARRNRNVECGLYRVEDLQGVAQYLAFPKQPGRSRASELAVTHPTSGDEHRLRALRAGFFRPLWLQAPFVDAPLECAVQGDPQLRQMLFPRREFWILTIDPENPYGAWATWKPYLELGERLLVLCRKNAFDDEMARFKKAKLVAWDARVECEGWVEYHGCMVLSYDWGGFITTPECRALADALSPRAVAGLSLSGGLRDPNQNAWLEGYPPLIKVYGFDKQFEVIVQSAHGDEVYREDLPSQQVFELPRDLAPDTYEAEVRLNGRRVAIRVFRVVSWSRIQVNPEPELVTNTSVSATAGLTLHGARIIEKADSAQVHYA